MKDWKTTISGNVVALGIGAFPFLTAAQLEIEQIVLAVIAAIAKSVEAYFAKDK